jgi:hypothetical protein
MPGVDDICLLANVVSRAKYPGPGIRRRSWTAGLRLGWEPLHGWYYTNLVDTIRPITFESQQGLLTPESLAATDWEVYTDPLAKFRGGAG